MEPTPKNWSKPAASRALLVDRTSEIVAAFQDAVTRHSDLVAAVEWLRERVQQSEADVVLGADCPHPSKITGIFSPLGVQVVHRVSSGSMLLGEYYTSVLGDAPEPEPYEKPGRTITVATDGSWRKHRQSKGTWAAVSDSGDYLVGRVKPSRFGKGPEDQALVAAFGHWSQQIRNRDDKLVLLSDSTHAIETFKRWLDSCPADRFRVRRTEVRWVRGHNGHPLNDAADRLARAARRSLPMQLPRELADQIVQPAISAYAEGFEQAS